MHNCLKLFILMCFLFTNTAICYAKDFSFEESFVKMHNLYKAKKYNKALKLGLKIKKEDINKEQKELLQKFMETAVIQKQMDDAVKTFVPSYDKYEDFYKYTPIFSYGSNISPYIYAWKDLTIYKLKFTAYYKSRTRMYPDLVILNSDGNNIVFKPFSGDDVMTDYDTHQRRVTAWVNLSDKEVYSIVNFMNGKNVSFKIKDTKSSKSAEAVVFQADKQRVKNGFWVYGSLRDKIMERGQNRI